MKNNDELTASTLKALVELGGSGSIYEINYKVYEIMKLSNDILEIPHNSDRRSEVDYKLSWSRTYFKKYGLIKFYSWDLGTVESRYRCE
ncbi:MAG: winged helix-turn-helix domain-containing protein [Campylobacteraceae bacterium]|jgi:restriction system protein|nr:winged helix-turn-helix domain-containing protein [Campylobacteraceae bacterium]